MNFGVQYYRAPFPDAKHWESDFKKIRESGFNTVQLWISWGWVEATPDRFVYDDYDRLVELAAKHRLGVVLSTMYRPSRRVGEDGPLHRNDRQALRRA